MITRVCKNCCHLMSNDGTSQYVCCFHDTGWDERWETVLNIRYPDYEGCNDWHTNEIKLIPDEPFKFTGKVKFYMNPEDLKSLVEEKQ